MHLFFYLTAEATQTHRWCEGIMNIEVATLMNHGCVATPRIGIDGLSPMIGEMPISVCRSV